MRIAANPGEAFLDRMIGLVEGATRQKTPNEIALTILLVALTLVFLLRHRHAGAVLGVQRTRRRAPARRSLTALVALLVCLIPTTIGGLLSAIGIAGMDRLLHANVIAMSGPRGGGRRRRRHAAARQDRHHHPGQPPGHGARARAGRRGRGAGWRVPQSSPSLADETPEGRTIVVLAKARISLRGRDVQPRPARTSSRSRRRPA